MENKNIGFFDLAYWEGFEIFDKSDKKPEIIGGIPSLQRGLVWKPEQVEKLWDSIFRGFPIGAIIGMEKGEEANTSGDSRDDEKEKSITHYILDGQQRAHNIALACYDPIEDKKNFEKCETDEEREKYRKRSYLWIDLIDLDENSSKPFGFRLVTPAHPWGYNKEGNRLSTDEIVAFLENFSDASDNNDKRPFAFEGFPQIANRPVPLSMVLKAVIHGEKCIDLSNFLDDCPALKKRFDNPKVEINDAIREGCEKLRSMQIPFISLPSNMSEHMAEIFERLNKQGTPVSNIDLFYSRLKAIFPGIEKKVEKAGERLFVQEASLAISSVRVLLTPYNEDKPDYIGEPSLERLKSIKENDSKNLHRKIESYFFNKNVGIENISDFMETLVMDEKESFLLPKAALISILNGSREILYWVLWLAKHNDTYEFFQKHDNGEKKKQLIGLLMILDIFGMKKNKVIKKLFEEFEGDLQGIVPRLYEAEEGKRILAQIMTPDELKETLNISRLEKMDKKELVKLDSIWKIVELEIEDPLERAIKWEFVYRLIHLRTADTLLLYAQREYYFKHFESYGDFSFFWKEHNRPWDYDHILPQSVLHNKRNIAFKKLADPWVWNLGNYRILNFSDNRSRKDKEFDCQNKEALKEHLIADEKCEGFAIGTDGFNDLETTMKFIDASRNRLITIYEKWWNDLNIEYLVGKK